MARCDPSHTERRGRPSIGAKFSDLVPDSSPICVDSGRAIESDVVLAMDNPSFRVSDRIDARFFEPIDIAGKTGESTYRVRIRLRSATSQPDGRIRQGP